MEFYYETSDFIFKCMWPSVKDCPQHSDFDDLLERRWNNAMENGYFEYKMKSPKTKILEGKYGYVAQCNPERMQKRRKPQEITSVSQPFNPKNFNFTKIRDREILFEIAPKRQLIHCTVMFSEHTNNYTDQQNSEDNTDHGLQKLEKAEDCLQRHLMIINVSPLEYCHSLLVPDVDACESQAVSPRGIQFCLETLLLSATPAFRVGFNSLCAFASVNHHHYHVYYLHHQLLLETIEVKHLCGPCYELVTYPAVGFVFQLEDRNIELLVRSVYTLTSHLQRTGIAYNVFMTRGTSFSGMETKNMYDTIRVFVWARKSSYGAKDNTAFNVAVCELAGQLLLKSTSQK